MPVNNDLFGNSIDSYNSLENVLMEAKVEHLQPHEVHYSKDSKKIIPLDNIWHYACNKTQKIALSEIEEIWCFITRA